MRAHTPAELGLAIRERRRALGLEQRELAARVGASRQWVVDLEKGKPGMEIGLILRALRALQLDLFVEPVEASGPATQPDHFDPLEAALARARRDPDEHG